MTLTALVLSIALLPASVRCTDLEAYRFLDTVRCQLPRELMDARYDVDYTAYRTGRGEMVFVFLHGNRCFVVRRGRVHRGWWTEYT